MKWFKPLSTGTLSYTAASTPYHKFSSSEVALIDETEIDEKTLMFVRIDIPHQVFNLSNTTRYCISLRGFPIMDWKNISSYFSKFIKSE
jgi:hypothetical protein